MNISTTIQRLRQEALLSQYDLALKVGVSYATIRQWETGASQPNMGMLVRLARVFGTTPSAIVDYKRPSLGNICVPTQVTKIPLSKPKKGDGKTLQRKTTPAGITEVPSSVIEEHPRARAFSIEACHTSPSLPGWTTYVYDPYCMPGKGDPALVRISPTQTEIRKWQHADLGITVRGIDFTDIEYNGSAPLPYPYPLGTICWYQSSSMLV